ncbi:hypothetical protein ACJX0J_034876, partial [Zea mays]
GSIVDLRLYLSDFIYNRLTLKRHTFEYKESLVARVLLCFFVQQKPIWDLGRYLLGPFTVFLSYLATYYFLRFLCTTNIRERIQSPE